MSTGDTQPAWAADPRALLPSCGGPALVTGPTVASCRIQAPQEEGQVRGLRCPWLVPGRAFSAWSLSLQSAAQVNGGLCWGQGWALHTCVLPCAAGLEQATWG